LTPFTGPAAKAAPLIEIAVQPAPQVAVRFEKPPARVTVLLEMVALNAWPVRLLKLKALAVKIVVADHVPEVVPPTMTVAVVAVP
jgi:hypothetical protein